MKIGPLENQAAAAPAPTERRPDAARPLATAGQPPGSATVALSPAAAALAGQVAEASFDQAKVDRVAQAIRDGSFQIHAESIADKLIANAQELLGKAGR